MLCVILTLYYPGTALNALYSNIFPKLVSSHSAVNSSLFAAYSLLLIGTAVFSFIAGLKLWLLHPDAVGFAKRYLLVYLAAHIAYFIFWITAVRSTPHPGIAKMAWYHLGAPMGTFTIWCSYLQYSTRVRATYSLEQIETAQAPPDATRS